ncbi:MAG: sulfotransferase, partial [Fidelibacterota bacterium]
MTAELPSAQAVCITGMHRAGTSMVARLLNLCGLYLGPEDRIMPPDEGNPSGYWQNQDMDQISEDIMTHFAGVWDFLLPAMPTGWESQSELKPLHDRARQLLQALAPHQRWGWKDPRASLTLPFWKSLLPGLKVVICLRNPVEVSRSLARHTGGTAAFSYNLWLHYYQRLLADTHPEDRLLTHYDMYFVEPHTELQRVLEWLEWSVTDEQVDAACQTISSSIRQQHTTKSELEEARIPIEVVDLYEALCEGGGPGLRQALEQGRIPP